MIKSIKIGIVVADIDEFLPLSNIIRQGDYTENIYMQRQALTFYRNGAEVIAVHCGIGKVNAAAATAHLIDLGCNVILNYGLSGGIHGICRGELCLCDNYLEHDFDLTGIGYKPCEKPGQEYIYKTDSRLISLMEKIVPDIKKGTAVTGDSFICDEVRRSFLKDTFNAMCCDMETAAIASVCQLMKVPFAAVRKISDDAGNTAGESYRLMNSANEMALPDLILQCIDEICASDGF